MRLISRRKIRFILATSLCLLALSAGLTLLWNYFELRQTIISPIKTATRNKTARFANQIDRRLSRAQHIADKVAKQLLTSPLDEKNLRSLIRRLLHIQPDLVGAGLAFAPFAFDRDVRLFAPYEARQQGKIASLRIEDHGDYTLDDSDWYRNAFEGGAGFSLPRYSFAAKQTVVEYALPFFHSDPITGEKIKQGILFLHYAFTDILEDLNALNLGKSGYGVLISKAGYLLVHPHITVQDATQKRQHVSEETHNPLINDILNETPASKARDFKGISEVTGKPSWVTARVIESLQWTVASYRDQEEFTHGQASLRRTLIWIIICIILFVLSLIVMDLSRKQRRSTIALWMRAFYISVLFIAGIASIWSIGRDDITWKDPEKMVIVEPADLDAFKLDHLRDALKNRSPLPVFIPTGIFVQSIEFDSANNVSLTGYIWQHYQEHVPKDFSRGFIFPEAESSKITEAYRIENDSGLSIGSYFQVTLRQAFDYSRYPFDHQSVWIRLWHEDFDKNAVLLPDLEAYDKPHPERLPGIEQDFVLPGWEVSSSFFNYRLNRYNTDFGIDRQSGQHAYPELYFEIGIKRRFLNPFISNLTPLIIVLLMLFAVLITSTKKEDKIQFMGFNASAIIGASSALFFVVLVSHIDIRSSLSANEIFYLEYFYVVAYGTIFAIAVNSILFSWGIKVRFVQYRDNLLPKIFYWPIITAAMFIVTAITFY